MSEKKTDKVIIEGLKNQDDDTLNWLYDNYFQTVRKYVISNSGTLDDVSDVFQDSIIILYTQVKNGSLVLTSDLKGYFFGIARNIWKSHLRKTWDTTDIDNEIPDEPDNDNLNDLFFERIMSRAFQKLKPDMQQILTLYSEGCSYDEIASRMNLKSEQYARRKKYLSKEALMELVREDPEYQEYLRLSR